ncbi:MAG: hypothetical protein M0P57_07690 [Syntrophales bacterium]|nr:hypothetical protein [Syntrophales bacterium]
MNHKQKLTTILRYLLSALCILFLFFGNAFAQNSFLDKIKGTLRMEINKVTPVKGKILFISDRIEEGKDSSRKLYLLNQGKLKRLRENVISARWSPDGEYIVCKTVIPYSNYKTITILDKEGSFVREILKTKDTLSYPAFSLDGNKIVFASNMGMHVDLVESLFLINRDGTGLKRILDDSHAGHTLYIGPSPFTPEGQNLIFGWVKGMSLIGKKLHIYSIANGDDPQIIQLTNGVSGEQYPTLSPDGCFIAFLTFNSGDKFNQIYVQEVKSGKIMRVTESNFPKGAMCWSPDGKQICYTGFRQGLPFAYSELFVINVDGSDESLVLPATNVGKVWSTDSYPDWTE